MMVQRTMAQRSSGSNVEHCVEERREACSFRGTGRVFAINRVHRERWHEGLRGVDQWQMAPARQRHEVQRRFSHPFWQTQVHHLMFLAAEGIEEVLPRSVQTVILRLEEKLVGVSRATRVCLCEENGGVIDSTRSANSSLGL